MKPQRDAAALILLSLLGLCSFAAPRVAMAQAGGSTLDLAEEADLHFRIGIEAYQAGRFREALEHLLLSNRLAPNRNVGFNIGRCYEQLGEYPEAYRHYSDFIADEPDVARRKPAEEARRRIEPRVALVTVTTDPPGATLYVDRKDLGARGSSPRTLALGAGKHKIVAELDGYEVATSVDTELRIGNEIPIHLKLRPILGRVYVGGAPAGAEIRVDDPNGPVLGTLPATLELVPGNHVIIVSAPGHQAQQQMVAVQPRESTQTAVNLDLVTGGLVVNATERGALIEIDGKSMGFTPAVLPAVPSGSHTLKVTLGGYRPFEEKIEIAPNGQATVNVKLRSLQEVTAASRAAEAIEDAPASVSLISQDEIRAFGYETLYDAIGGTRGVYQTNDLIYQYLGFRGFSQLGDYGNRVLVTLDGHTMNDDQLGSSYVGNDFMSDLTDVERIEVVRGPGSTLYGSNAFFGVLNVVTRDADTRNPSHVSIAADGTRAARVRAGVSANTEDGVGMWISAGVVSAQGRDYYFEEFDTEELGDGRSDDADSTRSGTFATRMWAGDITFQALVNAREKRIPNGAYGSTLADPRAMSSDTRSFLELRYEPTIGERVQLYSRLYVDGYTYEGVYPYTDEAIGLVEDTWSGGWFGAEPRVVLQAAEWLSLTGGAEARLHYKAELKSSDASGVYLDEDARFDVYSAYAVADASVGTWLDASLGARYDNFTNSESALNPRATLILKPSADNVFKLMAGSAFRAPSPYELNYNDGGYTQKKPNKLDPERVVTGEFEYTHKFSEVTSLVGTVYTNQITDLIDTAEVCCSVEDDEIPILQYHNTSDKVLTFGQEAEIRREWREGWMLALSQSFQRTRYDSLSSDYELENSPAHLLSLKTAAPLPGSGAVLASRLRYESARMTREEGTYTDPAVLWDLTVTGQLPALSARWAFGVRNLLDWEVDHPGNWDYVQLQVEQPGRTFHASTTYTF